ncbi:MAG: GC-type dockerin domain-anchored protein [Phycisphaerales bacterium]
MNDARSATFRKSTLQTALRAILVGGSTLLLTPLASAADVISDGEFLASSWTVQLAGVGFGGTGSSTREGGGGNPDARRRVQTSVLNAPNGATQSMLWVVHIRNGYSYNPASRGALTSISLAEDCQSLTLPPVPQMTGPLVRQNGVVYVARGTDTGNVVGWHRVTGAAFTQNSFVLLDTSDPVDGVEQSLHPNFGASGAPIEVGFFRALGSGLGGGLKAADQSVDNLVLTVTPAAGCVGDLNGDNAVNTQDLTAFLGRFGQTVTPGSAGDLNNDGAVNTQDLTAFLGRFGATC